MNLQSPLQLNRIYKTLSKPYTQKMNKVIFHSLFALLLTLSAHGVLAVESEHNIWVVAPENQAEKPHTIAFIDRLSTHSSQVKIETLTFKPNRALRLPNMGEKDLVIAVGPFALNVLLKKALPQPLLSVFVSKPLYESIVAMNEPTRPVSAIFADPDPKDQLSLFSGIYPSNQRIGVILSEQTNEYRNYLMHSAEYAKVSIHFELISSNDQPLKEIKRAIQRLNRKGVAAILAFPDYQIYNQHTIGDILQTAYRQQLPIIGFSQDIVKLGAVASVYFEPSHIASEVWDMYQLFQDTGRLNPARFSSNFNIAINRMLAKSFELFKTNPQELLTRIKANSLITDKAFRFVYIDGQTMPSHEKLL